MRTITDSVGAQVDPASDSPDRAALRASVRKMIADVAPEQRVLELDDREEFDDLLHQGLADLGAMAVGAHPDHGGAGDLRDQLVVVEELAAGPTSMAVFMIVHYMAIQILSTEASPEQRATWLDRLVEGRAKFSFALTEPGAGTDIARAMRTAGRRDGDDWVLSGQKAWISGAQRADAFILLARTSPVEDGSTVDGITMFLVPRDSPGITVRELATVAVHGLDTCEVFLDDVRLPSNAVIGNEGEGFRQVIATLSAEAEELRDLIRHRGSAAAAEGIAKFLGQTKSPSRPAR